MSQYFSNIYDVVKTMISGMSLTLEHLRKKKDLVATLQYPNEKWPQPERSIGFEHKDYNVIRSRLHVDIDDCIGCLQCERACPVDCIKIDTIKPSKGNEFDCGVTSNDTKLPVCLILSNILNISLSVIPSFTEVPVDGAILGHNASTSKDI